MIEEDKIRLNQNQIDSLFKLGVISKKLYLKNPDIELKVVDGNKILMTAYRKRKQEPILYEFKYCPRTKIEGKNSIKKPIEKCKYRKYSICCYRPGLIKYFENIDLGIKKFQYMNCILFQ